MLALRHAPILLLLTLNGILGEVNDVNDSSSNAVSGARIFKCKCDVNEALNSDGECVPSQNPIQVWDYMKQQDLTVDVSMFSTVDRNSVECLDGFTKLNLNRSHFVIYTNGKLDNLLLVDDSPTDNYCIEHVLTPNGIDIVAEVCEENPSIPTCCPFGYETTTDGECAYHENLPFNPPLIGDFEWSSYNTTQRIVTCGPGKVLKRDFITQPYYLGASLVSYPLGEQLQYQPIDGLPQYFSSKNYCLSVSEYDQDWYYFAHFCIPDKRLEHIERCTNRTCLRKCCPYNQVYDETLGSCVQYFDFQIKYKFIDSTGNQIPYPDNLIVMLGLPYCNEVQTILYNDTDDINFFENGSLPTDGLGTYSSLYYCVEGHSFNLQDPNNTIVNSAFICLRGLEDPCSWRWIIGTVLLSISCFFYLLTLLVYATIEELRSKMVGKCLISEVASLLITYLTLIYLINNNSNSKVACILPGTIEHFAILASFFWLNVMCFDMWSNIRKVQASSATSHTGISRKFVCYCLYAWGIPLFIALLRVIIDHLPEGMDQHWLIKSHLGQTHCFFSGIYDPIPKWLYLYLPILVLLVVNLFFFIHVAVIIVRTKKEAQKLLAGPESNQTGKNINSKKERALLYLKLFLVMGISWILEIVSWVAVEENDCTFWGLDIVNMFQGVFIFVIFVCKKSTIEKIKKKFKIGTRTPRTPIAPPKREHYFLAKITNDKNDDKNVVA